MASGYDVRCSVIVLHKHAVLLLHRTRDGLDDWVLPGGTPREGESMTACARRELFEETGISADPSRVASWWSRRRQDQAASCWTSCSRSPSRCSAGRAPGDRGCNRIMSSRAS